MGSNPSTESNNTTEITARNKMQVLCMRRQGKMESSTHKGAKELKHSSKNHRGHTLATANFGAKLLTARYCSSLLVDFESAEMTCGFEEPLEGATRRRLVKLKRCISRFASGLFSALRLDSCDWIVASGLLRLIVATGNTGNQAGQSGSSAGRSPRP
ncbi:hypothetical protein F511_37823 [Dorcoceras hygrometricum]|uniref:Uncharacterized protein n=1 Tax=Dorcoceras hygrometricum TaxID=472368 RepID=A0A2Z7CZ22_9LAMI|nr:hypothetical protein F511_37823 [Dorcoceras hygrometricum]